MTLRTPGLLCAHAIRQLLIDVLSEAETERESRNSAHTSALPNRYKSPVARRAEKKKKEKKQSTHKQKNNEKSPGSRPYKIAGQTVQTIIILRVLGVFGLSFCLRFPVRSRLPWKLRGGGGEGGILRKFITLI
jgi:hypothetical protein